MKSIVLILMMLVLAPVMAEPGASVLGVEPGSQEWKRIELEEWLIQRSMKDVSAFIKPEDFRIQMKITFAQPVKPAKQIPLTNVNVPLLGTVATFNNNPPQPKAGTKTVIEKIARLDVTLIVSENVGEASARSMSRVIRQSIPLVPADKISIDVVRLESPSLGLVGWIREFKIVIGFMLLLGMLLLGMRYILPRIRFQTAIKFGPATNANPTTSQAGPFGKLHLPMMVPLEVLSSDEPTGPGSEVRTINMTTASEGGELLDSLLPQTLAAVELRRLRSLALTLSISECIQLVRADVQLGSILVNLLPPEKTTSILAQLSSHELSDLKKCTLEWDSTSVARDSAALMTAIQEFKGVTPPTENERLKVFVDQVGPEHEVGIYDDLIRLEKFDQLASLSRTSPPAELIPEFPLEVLHAAFERMSFKEKAAVLSFESNLGARLCPAKSKDLVHQALRPEIERVSKNEKAKATAWLKFVGLVRDALEKNPQWQRAIKPIIENWLFEKSQGVVGVAFPAGKRGRRDDVA